MVARIKPSYYEQSGRFSFYCDAITPVGEGRLLARLEQTKRLLQAEGLFDAARKRPLPFLPRRGRADHRRRTAPPSATWWRTPAAAGRPSGS